MSLSQFQGRFTVDGLWAAAFQLYREGQQWEYTSGQLADLSQYQDDFLERDSWYEAIGSYVFDKAMVTTAGILRNAIDIGLDRINNGHQRLCTAKFY